jgi:hypothetical protein
MIGEANSDSADTAAASADDRLSGGFSIVFAPARAIRTIACQIYLPLVAVCPTVARELRVDEAAWTASHQAISLPDHRLIDGLVALCGARVMS